MKTGKLLLVHIFPEKILYNLCSTFSKTLAATECSLLTLPLVVWVCENDHQLRCIYRAWFECYSNDQLIASWHRLKI